MAELSPIDQNDFDEIFSKYLADDDARLQKQDWQTLFTPLCRAVNEPLVGYKLTKADKIVGILGMILSVRRINDQDVKFCNLHSWFVDEDQRGNSLLLMRPVLRLNDHIITDFSPTPDVFKISSRLGFRTFRLSQRMLLSAPQSGKGASNQNVDLKWDDQIGSDLLDDSFVEIGHDYSSPGFHRLLIQTDNEKSLIVLRVNRFHWRPYADVLFVSNPSLLCSTQPIWHPFLLEKLEVKRIAGPAKYLPSKLKRSYRVPFAHDLLYRSSIHGPEMIDTLYSEVSHLGLTSLPGARYLLGQTVRSLNPVSWFRKRQAED